MEPREDGGWERELEGQLSAIGFPEPLISGLLSALAEANTESLRKTLDGSITAAVRVAPVKWLLSLKETARLAHSEGSEFEWPSLVAVPESNTGLGKEGFAQLDTMAHKVRARPAHLDTLATVTKLPGSAGPALERAKPCSRLHQPSRYSFCAYDHVRAMFSRR